MVMGFESFREAFERYEDCYTINGVKIEEKLNTKGIRGVFVMK